MAIGFAFCGTVAAGTEIYALTIGPIVQFFLPLVEAPVPGNAAAKDAAPAGN